jgi:hypothetical protein
MKIKFSKSLHISQIFRFSIYIIIPFYLLFSIFFGIIFIMNGYSKSPKDWYEFIGMINGIVSLFITIMIAFLIQEINKKTTSRYAKLPYTIATFDQFNDLTLKYYDQRAPFIRPCDELIKITTVYSEEISKLIYFKGIYFDREIVKLLNDFKLYFPKYLHWLVDMKNSNPSDLDFVCDHSGHTQYIDDLYAQITKKIQAYITIE